MKAVVNRQTTALEAKGKKKISSFSSTSTIWAGIGAAGGAIAGVVIGAGAGPMGAFLGLMACSLAGGLAGRGVSDKSDLGTADSYLNEDHTPGVPSAPQYGYPSDHSATVRAHYQFPTRDQGKKYLDVTPGFVGRLREAQTFQSNLG